MSRTGSSGSPLLCAETVRHDEAVVVSVRGELDLATTPALVERLLELLQLRIESLTLDLRDLAFIDGSGISGLNAVRVAAGRHRVEFALTSLPEQARRVLELTEMVTLFRVDGATRDGAAEPRRARGSGSRTSPP